jgi:ABC-type nitrate/sulfonate/bicarbonate transport system substrate-binding protein
MPRKRTLITAGVAVLAMALAGCGGDDSGGNATSEGGLATVKVGVTAINASHLWVPIARDEKLMEPFGIDFQPVVFQGGAAQVLPAVLGGSTQFGIAGAQQTIIAYQQEPSLAMILNPMNGSPLSIVAKQGIATPADLRGKTISVNSAGSSEDYLSAVAWLREQGISPDEVNFVTGGATSARVSALISGNVDAVLCSPPDVGRLTEAGATVLGEADDVPALQNQASYVIVGKKEWLEANHDAAVRFAQGYQATQKFMRDPANRDAVIGDIADELGIDQDVAGEVYEYWINEFNADADPTGAVHVENLEQTLQNGKDNGVEELMAVTPDSLTDMFDNSYAEAAAGAPAAN